jgi:negative regulator of flagellin synthesis FlgM
MEGSVKIRNEDGVSRGLPQASQSIQGGRLDPNVRPSSAKSQGGDRVELSDRARALLVASDAMEKLPAVRVDKVESLKQLIKDGKYHVPGEKIAERLLGEGLFA